MYSFGVLLCEMCIREQPDPGKRERQTERIIDCQHRYLARRCVQKEPWVRPNTEHGYRRTGDAMKSGTSCDRVRKGGTRASSKFLPSPLKKKPAPVMQVTLAKENSRHFATPPLVSPQNERRNSILMTCTIQIWVGLLID